MYRGLLVVAAAVVAAPQAEDGEEVTRLQLVTLRGDECRAGSCHTAAECGAAGGEEGGSCAGGFGVCCLGGRAEVDVDTVNRSARNRKRKKKNKKLRIVFTGESCDFINFGSVRRLGAGCVDGTKMVLKNRAGVNRKQFLIADGKTIYAFPARGQKYPTCQSFTDKSSAIKCKAVVGLSSVSLSGSKRRNVKMGGDRVYTGNNCEWIDLNLVSSNADCDIGDKFVLKNKAGENRRQFLFMDGKTILAFVPQGQKFYECSSYTEVTVQVDCKAVPGAADIVLTSAGNEFISFYLKHTLQ